MASSNTLIQKCSVCPSTDNLMRCSRCQVVFYCSREHQTSHFPSHKSACSAVSKKRTKLETEYEKLRTHPGDELFTPARAFENENAVGSFWSMPGTRPYMRARFAFVDALGAIDTRDAVETQLEHERDMVRLSRSDNMGMRELIPFAMLRTDRDQDCYDFLKWNFTTGMDPDYDWGNMSLGYLDVKNADVCESVASLGLQNFQNLAHVTALMLLKIKLLLDLQAAVPRSSIVANNRALMATKLFELEVQTYQLYSIVHALNPHFWRLLFSPQPDLTDRPFVSSEGTREQAQLVLVHSYRAWVETRGALDLIKFKVDSGEWRAPPGGGPRRPQQAPFFQVKSPYALVQAGDRLFA